MKTWITRMTEEHPDGEALARAGEILRSGGLVAFPTETVYGLGGNALDPTASRRIYEAKGRPSDNPLIVHIAELSRLPLIAREIPEKARRLAKACWPGPLTMIFPKTELVPRETTGGLDTVAVRFPSHRIARELIRVSGCFVAAPSANASGRPSTTKAGHVIEDMDGKIDCIIDGGDARIGLESTILDFTEEVPMILRPGYYSQEMLESVIGPVRMDPGILQETPHTRPKAPGMRYRHYAPKARLILVEGSRGRVVEEINRRTAGESGKGRRVGILCADETFGAYPSGEVKSIGSLDAEEEIAHRLFSLLREFDETGVDVIFSEAFDTPRMGQAIMNRLLRAAGHQVIEV